MEITEKDLFNYIFYKDALPKDKAEYLGGTATYKDEIDFFSSLKDSLKKEIPAELKRKISEKIPAYKFSQTIALYPVVEKIKGKRKSENLVLAADSIDIKNEPVSLTFSDEKKEYLVKLFSSGSVTRISVFSTAGFELKNIKLIIKPGQQTYLLKDNSAHLELDEKINVESILLEFI